MWTATTGHKCLFKNNSIKYKSTSTFKVTRSVEWYKTQNKRVNSKSIALIFKAINIKISKELALVTDRKNAWITQAFFLSVKI